MDDLSKQLQSLLSDPGVQGQLSGLLASLGQGKGEAPAPAAEPDLGALAELTQGGGGLAPEALSLAAKLGPLLGKAAREDDAARLLKALRPLLGEARQKKLDEALRILQLLRLLPLLKESGAFSGLLAGLL